MMMLREGEGGEIERPGLLLVDNTLAMFTCIVVC